MPAPENIMTEWTSARCLALIKAYEDREILWNPKDGHYYDRERKSEAWAEIAQELDATQYEVRKKLESLTASFRREKCKEKRSKDTGARPYKSDWFAYKALSFLLTREDPKASASTAESDDLSLFYPESTDHSSDNSETIILKVGKSSDHGILEAIEKISKARKRKADQIDHSMAESARKFVNSGQDITKDDMEVQNICWQPSTEEEDPTTLFAKYLGKKLNQFDPRTRATLIHKINQLVFEAEMCLYDTEELNS